ncbi:hypothetical protein BDZ91DRAFT_304534 [Kalaharituber pfeilii]|nr:hypothetical protein BDZ91DRAFT_304534 [Kalaharituber pfeilii]
MSFYVALFFFFFLFSLVRLFPFPCSILSFLLSFLPYIFLFGLSKPLGRGVGGGGVAVMVEVGKRVQTTHVIYQKITKSMLPWGKSFRDFIFYDIHFNHGSPLARTATKSPHCTSS